MDVDSIGSLNLDSKIPTVRYGADLKGSRADVVVDSYKFGYDSAKLVADRGLRRITYLRMVRNQRVRPLEIDGLCDGASKFNLLKPVEEIVDRNDEVIPQGEFFAQTKVLQLIKQWKQTQKWSDALIVPDDIAMRGVAVALFKECVLEKQSLLIVCLANEGIRHEYRIPVVRYEFSPASTAREHNMVSAFISQFPSMTVFIFSHFIKTEKKRLLLI